MFKEIKVLLRDVMILSIYSLDLYFEARNNSRFLFLYIVAAIISHMNHGCIIGFVVTYIC